MKIGKRVVACPALFALGAAADSNARLTKVTTSYVSDSAGVLPLWLGKEAGIFARNALADLAELELPFVHTGLATTRGFNRDNPEVVRRYVRSHLDAIALMKKDREVIAKSYDTVAPDNRISRKQYPSAAGLQTVLDLLPEENPKAKSAKPDDFVDNRFIRELDQNGFIDGLK